MSTLKNILSALAQGLVSQLSKQNRGTSSPGKPSTRPKLTPKPRKPSKGTSSAADHATTPAGLDEFEPGRAQGSQTLLLDPERLSSVRISYAPSRDGDPDAGEVVWTWVPYEENDGRGKDRPVLVIGRQSAQRVYAVRMTSKAHDGDRDYIPIGPGAWDSQGRPSWVDIEQLYSVHAGGMRREAATLDRERYLAVAAALVKRYGWAVGD